MDLKSDSGSLTLLKEYQYLKEKKIVCNLSFIIIVNVGLRLRKTKTVVLFWYKMLSYPNLNKVAKVIL